MVRRYVVLSVVVASIVAGLALKTKPLQAAAASLGVSWNATQRWVSSVTPKTLRPSARVAALLEPQLPEPQQGGGGQTAVPRIWTDQPDYVPGEVVYLSGTGWGPLDEVHVVLHENLDDTFHEDIVRDIPTDASGGFSRIPVHTLEEHDLGVRYVATVTQGNRTAYAVFTDAGPSADLDHCGNGPVDAPVPCIDPAPPLGPDDPWINGNLTSGKAHYLEGQSVVYRARLENLALDDPSTPVDEGVHTLTIAWDTTAGGKHAFDYLTSFDRTETTADPCGPNVSGCSLAGPKDTLLIPLDLNVPGTIQITPQFFTMFNGDLQGASPYTLDGTYAGNSTTSITLTFKALAENPVLAWGAHVARRLDWSGNSAITISGSSYHMSIEDLDGQGGSQDHQISTGALIAPASVTIIKDTVPDNAQDFAFAATGGLSPAAFILDDDSDPTRSNTQLFSTILITTQQGNSYDVTETPVSPWDLSFPNACVITNPNPDGSGSTSSITNGVRINLKEGEDITCTFVNTRQTASLTLVKTVVGGTAVATGWFLQADGPGGTYGANGGGTYQVDPGQYTLSESGGPSDYTASAWVCTGTGTQNDGTHITLANGQSATCTITNTRDQGYLKLSKTFDAKTSGFAGTFAVVYNCGGAGDVTVNLAAGGSQTVGPFDTGTSCTVSEPTLPTNPTNWTFGTPSVSGSPATIVKGDQAAAVEVTVTNTITRDQGYLKLSKTFDAKTSGFAGTFAVVYNCGAGDQTVNLAAGGSQTVGPFNTGTSCTVTEPTLPTNPTNWTFGTPSISGSPATIAKGDEAAAVTVTVTNTITRDQGYLKITKYFNALTSGFAGTFAVIYNCGASNVTVNLAAGGSQTVGPFDTGTSCTVTEPTLPTNPTGWSFGTPSISGSPATIVKGTSAYPVSVSVTNTITRDQGSLKIIKSVVGAPAGFTGSFSVDVSCTLGGGTFNDRIINYPTPGFVTIPNIPTGSVCTVVEDTPTGAPTGYTWGTATVSGTATIAKDTTSEVTVTNTVTGRAKVVKTKAGGALGAGDSFTFQIRTGASTSAVGDIRETGYATQANGGVINFSYVLVPTQHYQLCELVMPGWNTNLAGTLFVPNSVVPPALPNPNVDNSPVCVDFVAQAGVTTTFNVDNTFPGGLARTIGFWKNWASCNTSNGKQKPVLDQTLASAQAVGGLVVSADSGTYPAFTAPIYLRLTDTTASPDIASDCAKAVALLNKSTIGGGNKKMASDPAFNLAAQLVAAELNFFAGAAKNGAVITAVNQAVVLLGKYKFDGNGYTPKLTNADANTMNNLATTLDNYNNNRP